MTEAARTLGIGRRTLYAKMKHLEIMMRSHPPSGHSKRQAKMSILKPDTFFLAKRITPTLSQ
ncbi:MAG: hypothetical protein B6245_04815 [Desulfobacteraceae bacterium 4572_88]|nr:MAG: hypothetical protein B6245_04815 [Desulfobacteraceae bacterium 4572_88]RLC21734.1 MAG: hypothetical protein DRI57_01640 [Deltaproteobacteria bacterium]